MLPPAKSSSTIQNRNRHIYVDVEVDLDDVDVDIDNVDASKVVLAVETDVFCFQI